MPLMGSLYIGVSGLQTSQNALNTTAHNVSNAENKGYVRQQILQATNVYNTIQTNLHAVSDQQIGLGVVYAKTRQVRDYFLDTTYRRESGRLSFYEVNTDCLGEIQSLLDEMNGESFQESVGNLWSAIQELSKDPSSAITQGLLIERCSEFLSRGKEVYQGLVDYQNSLNEQAKQIVYNINNYADRIKELNDHIRTIEAGGFETANDLRDERNLLIDELASYGNITYSEDADSTVWIKFEGEDLVRGDVACKMLTKPDPETGFVKVFWERNARYELNELGERVYPDSEVEKAKVFDMERVISSEINTDIGKLKATLLARGDRPSNYTDLKEGNYTNSVSQSLCMNIMAEFDQLIHNVATTINQCLADAADRARVINPNSDYMRDANGNPLQIFQKIASDAYVWDDTLTPPGYKYMDEDENVNETLYSITNLQINIELMQQPTKMKFMREDGSVDIHTTDALRAAFESESNMLNINVKKKSNFIDYYSDLISQVANSGYIYNSILDNQQKTVNATENARQQIVGVSTDEEMTFMIKFQNAYNASSRYINVVDEMLEHIINTLGM